MRHSIPLILIAAGIAAASCGESDAEKATRLEAGRRADSTRAADSLAALLKPRLELYQAAVGLVKKRLKAPGTARFAAVSLHDDTVKIVMRGTDSASVSGEYDSQNAFGTFLHGTYDVALRRDSAGAWVPQSGIEILDVRMD